MRIVFLGTPALAVPTLEALAARHDVVAVVTQPDRPQGRGGRVAPSPVKVWAGAHAVPVHQPEKLNDGAFEAWLRRQTPDLCVLVAYGRYIKPPLLAVPPLGWLNMHPSLLPRWRGPSPIQSALLAGDAETGVCVMRIAEEMDAGPVLLRRVTPIGPTETAAELGERLAALGAEAMCAGIAQLESGTAVFAEQDHAQATQCRMLSKSDGRIRWARPAAELHNLVRAANPWPVAHCTLDGDVVRIYRTEVDFAPAGAPPGQVVAVTRDAIYVATGEGRLGLREIQAPGKRAMPASAFLAGRPVPPGGIFGEVE